MTAEMLKLNGLVLIVFMSTLFLRQAQFETVTVTSSFHGITQIEKHTWSIGLPSVNFTFRNFDRGTKYITEVNSSEIVVSSCIVGGDDVNETCRHTNTCICHFIENNAYEAIFSIDLTDWNAKNQTYLSLQTGSTASGNVLAEAYLFISYCNSLTASPPMNIINGVNASFEAKATYTCLEFPSLIVAGESVHDDEYVRECLADTDWSGKDDAICWYAPENVTVIQKNKIANKPAEFFCSYRDGFPTDYQEAYYIEDKKVSRNETLRSDLHMKSYRCEVSNSYTNLSKNEAKSETGTLIVYFAPEKLHSSSLRIEIAENETEEVFFTFCANSPDNVTTSFSKINGSKLEHIHKNITLQGYYNMTYSITINSPNDYGEYIFIANTSIPPGSATQTITISEYDTTTDPTDKQNNIVIIASSCAALLVVIIALVIFLILYRKTCREKLPETSTNKEEKDNPLYGITTRDHSAGEPSSTKEERANPLYDTNSGTPDKVEEAYAAVDVRKKKKKKANKGTENSAFSPESNAAVYAAVDKSKKKKNDTPPVEAVYSEVNKKKGSNTAGLHGSSE